MTDQPARPSRSLLPWLIAAIALCGSGWLGLLAFQLKGRASLAEQSAQLADAEIQALAHDLEIERLLSQRLAGDTVDLAQARVALLSAASAGAQPAYAVVWSPTSGDGVIIVTSASPSSAQPHFALQATRRISSDHLESDEVFSAAVPPDFQRGLFHYRPAHPETVSAFSLRITTQNSAEPALRLGGELRP